MAYIINYSKHYGPPIVIACILNKSKGPWLLNDVLNITISMNLKLKGKMNHFSLSYGLIDDDDSRLIIELRIFSKKNKKEVIKVIEFSFIS
jgi:hypothetical protein